jgi:hypothetical protein
VSLSTARNKALDVALEGRIEGLLLRIFFLFVIPTKEGSVDGV